MARDRRSTKRTKRRSGGHYINLCSTDASTDQKEDYLLGKSAFDDSDDELVNGSTRLKKSGSLGGRSASDVPKIDSGVRMLCMDGGGAKGVIEATILDKIFVTVASTLKYQGHILNWVTIVIDKEGKEKGKSEKLDQIKEVEKEEDNKGDNKEKKSVEKLREKEAKAAEKLRKKEEYIEALILSILKKDPSSKNLKKIQRIDRTKDLSERKMCFVISGAIDQNDMFKPFSHRQKKKILQDEDLRKVPGIEIKDFLHGASKYWALLESDQTEETREKIKSEVIPFFEIEGKQTKCLKMLIPATYLLKNLNSPKLEKFENKDLLIFYWDQPVKTKKANVIRDRLLGVGDEKFREKYKPEKFIEELYAKDMFDLLIGTSTGSILSFGMGYKGLSPQECRDVYLKSIKNIFSQKYDKSSTGKIGLSDTLFRTVGDLIGQGHYSIAGVSDTLEENYNQGRPARTLMGGGDHRKECVVACVALNWQTQTLETFDTHNPRYKDWDLIQFLTASSDAPVYFTTPFTVKSPKGDGIDYIDGGLGANCPAVQGIDLAKERWRGADIELILSLGAGKDINPPTVPKNGGDWLKTLCSMVTDGDNIWERFVLPLLDIDEACKHTEKLRIQPKMELANFKADSTRVIEMCNLAEDWLNTSAGFAQVTEASGMIIAKSMKLGVESRILTEQDLLDWLAQTLPIGKSLFKSRAKSQTAPDQQKGITNDDLDMKFGRELHSLYVCPNSKLKKRFPAIDKNFIYIPKPVSVGQTDLRFTIKFDHDILSMYHESVGQRILKLHCPDNHEVRIIGNLDLYGTKSVYKVSNLVTVPLEETEQFHRLVHEASKEISQLHTTDRGQAEDKLCNALDILSLPEFREIREKYSEEHFMRIQAYFYLWKKTVSEVSLKALNETLIKVGMKKRPWPKKGRLGEPDVTVRTVIPAPPENMMFSIAVDYFQDRLAKARENNDKAAEKRYVEFMRHLGAHPAKKEAEGAKYKKKFFGTVFRSKRKDPKLARVSTEEQKPTYKKKTKDIRASRQSMPLNSKEQTAGNDNLRVAGRNGRSLSMVASPRPGLFGRNRTSSDASPQQARSSLAAASISIPAPRKVQVGPAPSSTNIPEMEVVEEEDDYYECDVTRETGEPPVVYDAHNAAEEKQSFLKSTRRFFNKKNKSSLPANGYEREVKPAEVPVSVSVPT
ncbi:hypothetical protein ACHWQZ_G008552 [Mnemiopsis leidyi]